MLSLYALNNGAFEQKTPSDSMPPLSPAVVWIDLFNPKAEEVTHVQQMTGAPIPSRAEMIEIEASSRLYTEGSALIMTIPVLNKALSEVPGTAIVTFLLIDHRLITIRYEDPTPFSLFAYRLKQQPSLIDSGEKTLLGLLEQIADRLADIMESAIAEMDALSRGIFRQTAGAPPIDFQDVLQRIGRVGDLTTRAKDSLLGLNRMTAFFAAHTTIDTDEKERFDTLQHDIASLDEHAKFLSERVGFLLNATLGMINIDQNNIIKIFSVVAVAFLPPTLIASIYGMNFEIMPELKWTMGYPIVLALMLLSVLIPFFYFRRKRWL